MKLEVTPYSPSLSRQWNDFVSASKNATFLFNRSYMDYHQDRFTDASLVVRKDQNVVCLLPANRLEARSVSSHQGLTYGGFLLQRDATLHGALEAMEGCLAYLEGAGVETLHLKRQPRFYSQLPDDEVDYAAFITDSHLVRRDCALVLDLAARLPLRKGKKHSAGRARRGGCTVREDRDFESFWQKVLQPRLHERYAAKPVHTTAEIRQLVDAFPENIRLFICELSGKLQAGMVIFETPRVAHLQYSALAMDALEPGALDYLAEWLIDEIYPKKAFFDFGTCNEAEGRRLNAGLLRSKEGFGARTLVHDFYEMKTAAHTKLAALLAAGSHDENPG